MFDLAFSAMTAVNQVAALCGGLFFIFIGGLLLYARIDAKRRGLRLPAEIAGVRQKDTCYFPVYRYTRPDTGEITEATSSTGSSGRRGKETGRRLDILVTPDKWDTAEEAGGFLFEFFALLFILPGLFLFYVAFTMWPVTWMTFAVLCAGALLFALKARKFIIPKDQRGTLSKWRAKRDAEKRAERAARPVRTVEEIMSSDEGQRILKDERKARMVSAPVTFILSCVMLWGGWHMADGMALLMDNGLRAPGIVTDFEESRGNDSDAWYPIVTFTDAQGGTYTFRGSFGTNPPAYDRGEAVSVLYMADAPQKSATIDTGLWNWLIPALLGIGGALMMILCLSVLKDLSKPRVL